MTIAIVEDEKRCRSALKTHLQRYEAEHSGVRFEITEFTDGLDILAEYRPAYDLIFLDIQMPLSNGMDVAAAIRKMDPDVVLIFLTNTPQYAIKGYEVGALDYILKPVPYFQFAFKLDRALQTVSRNAGQSFSFVSDSQHHRISTSRILFIEVIRHCLTIHTDSGDYEVWHRPLYDVAGELGSAGFALCSASILVNLRHVRDVSAAGVTVGGVQLPLTRGKRADFLDALSKYMG